MSILDLPGLSKAQLDTRLEGITNEVNAARDAVIATKAVHTFTQTFTLLPAASQVLPIKTTTAPLVLHKIATLITQAGLSNVDVELKVGTNLIYRAEGLAKSVDSTFSLFTEHLGALTLTVTNNGAVACDVKSTLYWCDL